MRRDRASLARFKGNNVADFTIDFAVASTSSVYERSWTGTPTTTDFGDVPVGGSSAPETIVIENTGDRPTEFGNLILSGGFASYFTVDENTCSGGSSRLVTSASSRSGAPRQAQHRAPLRWAG